MTTSNSSEALRIYHLPHGKLGMWLFLLMDGLSFVTILIGAAYLRTNGAPWPGAGEVLNVPLTAFNTIVLIVSSLTVMLALQAVREGDQARFKKNLLITLILGTLFLGVQAYEYTHLIMGSEHLEMALANAGLTGSSVTPQSSIYAACFYGATGFHGLHVLAGLIFMLYIIVQAFKGRWTAEEHGRVEYLALYWHFVDLMWMFVFTVVYLI
ncbi:MAG: heme-copper oxidase subunit III [Candidatus Omnitrophica bacterium]|nr:heme-copper oxidase subunit III [Candidatus Omnitrophota bacterium]